MIPRDITGKKYNRLTAIKYTGNSRWLWFCECGNNKALPTYDVVHGRIKSCGCLAIETARALNLKPPGEAALTSIFLSYKHSAKIRGLIFELSNGDIKNIICQPCRYCGAHPTREKKTKSNNGGYLYNGIDRVNNEIGYTLGNVVPCCWKCNETKRAMGYDEFIEWVKSVYLHSIVSK